ncbi:MAG: FHA domain-containing protein [Thermodesulfobacteriota bacterium]
MQNQSFISVSLDSKLLEKKKFDQESISIGRDTENDILINNLAVSRFHAKIHKESGKIIIKDLGSANGTFLNGNKIEWAEMNTGDLVLIGKHALKLESSNNVQDEAFIEGNTVMVDRHTQDKFLKKLETKVPSNQTKLISSGGTEVPINTEFFTIGKNPGCNIKLKELFVKDTHASIVRQGDGNYRIINSGSFFKPTKVNGNKISEKLLRSGDVIQIGTLKMVFVL